MKKILLLGGSFQQLVAIKTAKQESLSNVFNVVDKTIYLSKQTLLCRNDSEKIINLIDKR